MTSSQDIRYDAPDMSPRSTRAGLGAVGGVMARLFLLKPSKNKSPKKGSQLQQPHQPIKMLGTVTQEVEVDDLDSMIDEFNSAMAAKDKTASLVRFQVVCDTNNAPASTISAGVIALIENSDDHYAIEAMDLDLHSAAKATDFGRRLRQAQNAV